MLSGDSLIVTPHGKRVEATDEVNWILEAAASTGFPWGVTIGESPDNIDTIVITSSLKIY